MIGRVPCNCGREVVEKLPLPVLVLDRTFRAVLLNFEARRLFSASPGELVGQPITDILERSAEICVERELRRVLEIGRRVSVPYFHSRERKWFNISAERDDLGGMVLSFSDASHLRSLEQELDSVERKICEAFRNAALCVAVADENGWFLEANEAFLNFTGYTLEELRARDFVSITHPEDRDKHLQAGLSIMQDSRRAAVYEKRYVRKDGRSVWARMNVSVLARPEGHTRRYLALCEDVTEARAAVEQVRLSESRFRALIENSLDLISVIRPDGTILYESPAIKPMLGYRQDEIVGRNAFEYVHPDDLPQTTCEIAASLTSRGSTARVVFRFLHKNGTWRYLDGIGRNLLDEPGIAGIVVNCRDITERVENRRKLKEALDQAREATELKSRFLANMSHEIRTPMNGVVGLSELLLNTDLTSEQREYVEGIQLSAEVLLRVIGDILDFSKIEAGKLRIDSEPFNLRDLLAAVAELYRPLCRAKAVDFQLHVAPEVPDWVIGDRLRLRQVLSNLLSNAVKFTPAGRVELFADASVLDDRRVSVQFAVRDTGIGIPPEHQSRLFSSFMQGDSSTTRKFGGTGLGLAICKQLLGLMGGSIRLASVPGQGSEFRFELPLQFAHREIDTLAFTEMANSAALSNRC